MEELDVVVEGARLLAGTLAVFGVVCGVRDRKIVVIMFGQIGFGSWQRRQLRCVNVTGVARSRPTPG
jgi:hypothetical protein